MDQSSLIPPPEAIPLAAGWLRWLSLATFLLHLLAINLMLGGGIMALAHSLREPPAPPIHPPGPTTSSPFACPLPWPSPST